MTKEALRLKEGLDFASEWLSQFKERSDRSMMYWAYEDDARRMAAFILTGILPNPATKDQRCNKVKWNMEGIDG